MDRKLKQIRDVVAAHPALTFIPSESHTIGGLGRSDRFSYRQLHGAAGEIQPRVLVEVGTASGREPTADVQLSSYLGQFLQANALTLDAEDERPFEFRLLHFRRTFVEKLFAIHSKVELLKRDKRAIGSYARHYYGLSQLAVQPDVLAMLRSGEYAQIKADYDQISRQCFPRDYLPPNDLSFAESDALFPGAALDLALRAEYEAQCKQLCFGPYPTWDELRKRFEGLRTLL
jgi:hypothetical protein